MALSWRFPGFCRGPRNSCFCGCSITVLAFLSLLAPSIFFFGYRLHISSPFESDNINGEYSRKNLDWRERAALQSIQPLLSKEVLDVIIATTADMGPLSLDSLRKHNISMSWDVKNPVETCSSSEMIKTALDFGHGAWKGEEDQELADTPEKLYQRSLRQERWQDRANALMQIDSDEMEDLEEAAIERCKSVDSEVLRSHTIWEKEQGNKNSAEIIGLIQDQIIMARVYSSIAKMKNQLGLHKDLEIQLKKSQQALEDASTDTDLGKSIPEMIRALGQLLSSASEQKYDCKLVTSKLRAMLQTADEELVSLEAYGSLLNQLALKTLPQAMHCLSMRLTVEYHLLPSSMRKFSRSQNLENPNLYHYALFSDNVLAASVVVNSTIINAQDSSRHVFHLVTDKLNYGPMKMWFILNPPGNATIQVQSIDEFTWLNSSYCPVLRQVESAALREYYFKTARSEAHQLESSSNDLKYRNPKYISMLNHLRFYLPQLFPKLDKILFLDDDIVVQKDLSPLWSVDLKWKVNGAVETCAKKFHRFDTYLNFSIPLIARNFDPKACGWAYGMNIFDLKEWKKKNITDIYHYWQSLLTEDRLLWRLGTLPPGLIAFYNLTHPLEKHWHVLRLGYDKDIDQKEIENAAVIHYNGHMKPWLELAIPRYRPFWTKYINFDHPYLRSCRLIE